MTIDWIGWIATAIFVGSYLCKDPMALRRIQALAACLWVTYGIVIQATPIIVANLLVAAIAIYSSVVTSRRRVL
jgi:energy-converting hydrogenase Eha subunit B